MEPKVGIFIPTMNRSQFVERQLKYYYNVYCPHTIYIGDSSIQEHAEKNKRTIKKFSSRINIIYTYYPKEKYGPDECKKDLINRIKEKYAVFIGDDDFQIPKSLTRCAEFLETNPDYATVHGYAVALRIKNNKPYGEITKIKDYPQPEYQETSGAKRYLQFMENYYVSLFSVHRTENMIRNWEDADKFKDYAISGEMLPCSLALIDGKSKLLNCLSFVRQIHDQHFPQPDTLDWVVRDIFPQSFKDYQAMVSKAIVEKDKIALEEAQGIIKQGLWLYLMKQLPKEYPIYYLKNQPKKISIRSRIVSALPLTKKIYLKIKPFISKKKQIHSEVIQKQSPYYKDFQEIIKAITPEIIK